ncbi:MAG: glycerol-3-phosphate acyltransferase [Ilumatobacteraceae bacterium]|nr:glycerol-3-phosphate acyltransferase [Ilumatobacteraceae bacterium]
MFATTIAVIAICVLSYFLGTFPSAIMVATSKGLDITHIGSGNPGTSNIARAMGWKYGALVFVMDAGKGSIATAIGVFISDRRLGYLCGAVAIIGHMFPVQRKFKGGKGVATGAGIIFVMYFFVMLLLSVLWVLSLKLTKKASIGSILLLPLLPILFALVGAPAWEIWTTIGLGVIIEIRHTANIKRLLSGNEPPVSGASI